MIARPPVAKHGAGDRTLELVRLDREPHVALECAVLAALGLLDDDAALLGADRGRHHVDVRQQRPHHAGHRGGGQRLAVQLGDFACVLDADALDARLGELAGKSAQLLGELHPRLELGCLLGGDVGRVEGVGDRALEEIVRHLLGDLQRDVLLRLRSRGAKVWRADHVGGAEQHVGFGRLIDEHVEGGAGDVAGLQGVGKRLLVDEAAACAVDDANALLAPGDRPGVENVLRLLGHRRVQRDEVRPLQQRFEIDLLDAELDGALVGQERDRTR